MPYFSIITVLLCFCIACSSPPNRYYILGCSGIYYPGSGCYVSPKSLSRSRDLSGAVSDFEAPVLEAPVVFTLLMSLSPTFSAINLCLIYFLGLFGGLVALLETVARFLLFSTAQFP